MNEAETRAEYNDPALKAAGWGVVEGSAIRREFRITEGRLQGNGQRAKPEIADYVLLHRNIKLAVVEAKAWNVACAEGVMQAKAYAAKLDVRFTYAANGQSIYGIDMATGSDASALAGIYSRAKYGGVHDIRYLARQLIDYLCGELDRPDSQWSYLFQNAKVRGDNVVMMTTGWRNVPSTANVLYEFVVEEVNVKLAHMALPTIINVKLPRIAPPCEDYASLSTEERERVNLVQDHVIPAENFYRWSGVHVIFGDDVLVTGSTADKVLYESMRNGAKSFRAIYPVAIDPRVALGDASVEDRLNSVVVEQRLDDTVAELLSARDYQPILRTLRLLFGEGNRESLAAFLPKVPASTWLRLYKSALGNEFLGQPQCAPSLVLLREYLTNAGLLSTNGRAIYP